MTYKNLNLALTRAQSCKTCKYLQVFDSKPISSVEAKCVKYNILFFDPDLTTCHSWDGKERVNESVRMVEETLALET